MENKTNNTTCLTIDVQRAYSLTGDQQLYKLLVNEFEKNGTPSQDDTMFVPLSIRILVDSILKKFSDYEKIISVNRYANIVNNLSDYRKKMETYPCVTTLNNVVNNAYEKLVNLSKEIEDEFENTENGELVSFFNKQKNKLIFINKSVIDLIYKFENKTGLVLGFFENSYEEINSEELKENALYNNYVYLNSDWSKILETKEQTIVGSNHFIMMFGKKSNDGKTVYVSKEFLKQMEEENKFVSEFLTNKIDFNSNTKEIQLMNFPIDVLKNHKLLYTEKYVDFVNNIISYCENKNVSNYIKTLLTYSFPHDAAVVYHVFTMLRNTINDCQYFEDVIDFFNNKISDYRYNPGIYLLQKTIASNAETIMELWQYIQDYFYEIKICMQMYKNNFVGLESKVSRMYTVGTVNNKNQNDCIVEENNEDSEHDEESIQENWCNFDCHLCSSRKNCALYNDVPQEILKTIPKIAKGETPTIIIVGKKDSQQTIDDILNDIKNVLK